MLQCHFDMKFKAHLCSNSAKQTSWYLDLCCSPANSPARPRKNVRFAQNASLSSAFLMISLEINLSILSRRGCPNNSKRPPAQNRRLFALLGGRLLPALRICSTGIVFWAKLARSAVRVKRLTPCFSFVNWRVTEGACDMMFQFFPI